jgi:putative hemolysin
MTMRGDLMRPALVLAALALALAACAQEPSPAPAATAEQANPASKNCIAQGGELRIETAGDGGQYGLCLFQDNRQCEEWALLRGTCPVGGIKVTGYVTPQARYCAIRGGSYVVTRMPSATGGEQGTCTLPGEAPCDALALYEGRCS